VRSKTDSSLETEGGKPRAAHHEVAVLDVQGLNGREPQGENRGNMEDGLFLSIARWVVERPGNQG
jgi:hypothetical protein